MYSWVLCVLFMLVFCVVVIIFLLLCVSVCVYMSVQVDEGTAMLKAQPLKERTPKDGQFLYLNVDGFNLPSDHYLKLAGSLTAEFERSHGHA